MKPPALRLTAEARMEPPHVVHVLVAGEPSEHRLPQQSDECMPTIPAGACIREHVTSHVGQADRIVQLPIGVPLARWVFPRADARQLLVMSLAVTIVVWSLVLGAGVMMDIPIRSLWAPFWPGTLLLSVAGPSGITPPQAPPLGPADPMNRFRGHLDEPCNQAPPRDAAPPNPCRRHN